MEDITVMYHHIPKKARDRASFMFNRKEAERIEKATLGLISSGLTLPNFTKFSTNFKISDFLIIELYHKSVIRIFIPPHRNVIGNVSCHPMILNRVRFCHSNFLIYAP